MGLIYSKIQLSNPVRSKLKPITVTALVDTGANTLCIPEHIAIQLKLQAIETREVRTADNKYHLVPYVGPVQIIFEKRHCFTGALVIGDSVLMGAIPLEDMDLVVIPATNTLAVNPDSPNIPSVIVK